MRLMIAGGGTGGHVFPGLAVASEIARRDPSSEIVFVGTERGLEARIVPKAGYGFECLRVGGLKGVSVGTRLATLAALPASVWQSFSLLRRYRPQVVLGVGGYASGPTMLAAALAGYPTVLFEPNAQPGLANRLLRPVVKHAAVNFEEAERYFGAKAVRTGCPVRPEFIGLRRREHRPPFNILIFGGSQGALAINQAMLEALDFFRVRAEELFFVHQTGEKDYNAVRVGYARRGVRAEVLAFIDNMAERFAAADLIISRAGAVTVAELTAAGKAALLIPFPHATDQHQLRNARALERAGAARVIEQSALDAERLAREVFDLMDHPKEIEAIEQNARRLGRPDAAARIVDLLEKVRRP